MARLLRTYSRLVDLSLLRRGRVPRDQRRGRLFCLGFLGGYPLFAGATRLMMALDRLFFPAVARTRIEAPVFIIGNPRSGTTILHRLLSEDAQFFFFRSWEMWFPALTQKRIFDWLGRLDTRLGRPFMRVVSAWERKKFGEFNRMHEIGLFLPEEDEKLLLHILATGDAGFLFPYMDFERYAFFDEALSRQERDEVLGFYEACLRRQACLRGSDRRLLSKNPWFTGKIDSLRERFPDARFVYLVRSPLEVIPSMISLARTMIVRTFGVEPGPELDEQILKIVKHFYLEGPKKLARGASDRWVVVDYRKLIASPEETIQEIYGRLDLAMSDEFAAALARQAERMRSFRSQHRYSLDGCAIPAGRIVDELEPVFQEYGFERPAAAAASLADKEG